MAQNPEGSPGGLPASPFVELSGGRILDTTTGDVLGRHPLHQIYPDLPHVPEGNIRDNEQTAIIEVLDATFGLNRVTRPRNNS